MRAYKSSKTWHIGWIVLAIFLMVFSINDHIYAAPLFSASNVVINEIYQAGDWIELYNGTVGPIDISGWEINVVSACNTIPYTVPASTSIPSNGYLVIHGSGNPANNTSTDLYHTDCFSYAPEYSIAVALESTSTGVDFVRTGSSTTSPPLGTSWTGDNPPGGNTSSIGRDSAGTDTDDGSDWISQNPSQGAVNNPDAPVCIATVYGDGNVTLDPTNSEGCNYRTYVDGEVITLTADSPAAGYKIGGWFETNNDYNTTVNNTVTVDGPTNWHMVGVNYIQDPPPPGTVLVIENTWSEGLSNLSQYANALTALNIPYEVWYTRFTDSIPTASIMSAYDAVILIRHWGDTVSFQESYFSSYLDGGGCMLMSNQDYTLTTFLQNYFGVTSIYHSTANASVSGTGSIFGGLGPFTLDFDQRILQNSDNGNIISINASALPAFTADHGLIAATKETTEYKTSFMGFQFEALPTQQSRQDVLQTFYSWCVSSTSKPSTPTLTSPSNNAVLYNCQPEFSWSEATDTTHYEIDVLRYGSNGTNVSSTSSTALFTPSVVLRPDWYYWRARALNGTIAGDWSNDFWFKINVGAPNNVTPVTNDGTYSLTPTFDWLDVCGADGYDLFAVRYDETGTPQTAIYTGTTVSEYTPTSDLTPGVYAWYVRAKSGTEYGPWNTFYWLTLFIGAPNLQTPVTNDLVTAYPEFSWTEVPGATGYDLFVVKIEGEGNTTAIYEEYIPTTSHTDLDPLDSGIYAWYVRARAGHWVGPWTNFYWFVVP